MRIAILSDAHLPSVADTAQDAALNWAIEEIQRRGAEVIVSVGDLTAAGDRAATRRALECLQRPSLPYRSTAGNAEWRDVREGADSVAALTRSEIFSDDRCVIVVFDTSTTRIDEPERRRVEAAVAGAGARSLLLATHMPPYAMEAGAREWLEGLVARSPVALFLCGHGHRDIEFQIGGKPARMVRGLDPEKASGGPPALSWLTLESGAWRYEQAPFPGATLEDWTPQQRKEMSDLIGVSCVEAAETIDHLRRAADLEIRCVEVRAEAVHLPGLDQAVARWRRSADGVLSIHLPNAYWNDGVQSQAERSLWLATIEAVNALGATQMTLHPPRLAMDAYRADPSALDRLADRVAPYLQKSAATIAVENLHMSPSQTPDAREFGCLPHEVLAWRDAIRVRLGANRVGNLLDLGHARANGIFSSTVGIGAWFAHVGKDLVGYHLHQLDTAGRTLRCHFPITGLYGPGISYAAFLWAWRTGQITHRPVFLEVRGEAARLQSLGVLRDALMPPGIDNSSTRFVS